MLKPAILYADEIQKRFAEISDDVRFQYFYRSSYRDFKIDIQNSTWNVRQQACINNDKVIGYFEYTIDRDSNVARGLEIINFTFEPNAIFAKDLLQFLRNIFEKHKHRKLRFMCIADNPILRSYKRLCWKFGGRIVGIYELEDKLLDGEYHDIYLFEIMRDRYMKKRYGE